MAAESLDIQTLNSLIQGAATAIPSIVVLLIVVSKWKSEICRQISELRTEVEVHIGISERDRKECDKHTEKIDDIIRKNNLKF